MPRCVVAAFLEWIRLSDDHLLAIIVSVLLFGSFVWLVWFNFKLMHDRLDLVFRKIETLQQSIKV